MEILKIILELEDKNCNCNCEIVEVKQLDQILKDLNACEDIILRAIGTDEDRLGRHSRKSLNNLRSDIKQSIKEIYYRNYLGRWNKNE